MGFTLQLSQDENANGNREVVQPDQGLRVHRAEGRREGRRSSTCPLSSERGSELCTKASGSRTNCGPGGRASSPPTTWLQRTDVLKHADSMNPDELLERFLTLQIWSANGQRAPHKPLLALWAIGRCLRGEERLASYEEADRALTTLLRTFGPHRKSIHTEAPFWRMQTDRVWEVRDADLVTLTSKGDAHKSSLVANGIHAGFPKDVHATPESGRGACRENRPRVGRSAFSTWTIHEEVLEAVGIECALRAVPSEERRDRDSARESLQPTATNVWSAALPCVKTTTPVALEAAHIKWHQARGPDIVRNALALCALHHRLFDKGAFTVSPGRLVVVARNLSGRGFEETLGRFDARPLTLPTQAERCARPTIRILACAGSVRRSEIPGEREKGSGSHGEHTQKPVNGLTGKRCDARTPERAQQPSATPRLARTSRCPRRTTPFSARTSSHPRRVPIREGSS